MTPSLEVHPHFSAADEKLFIDAPIPVGSVPDLRDAGPHTIAHTPGNMGNELFGRIPALES